MSRPVEILILSGNPERRSRWTRFLTDPDTSLWQGLAELPADTLIDVIVSDSPVRGDQLPDGRLETRLAGGEIGVIGVGQKQAADVCLPSDAGPRELRLACCLLAETVRLRREYNRSRRMQRVLNQMALTDSLTGLPNRRAWDDELLQRDASPSETHAARCIALLDLDHFKTTNDTLGHLAGDHLLQIIGRRIPQIVAPQDFAARLGGDEFALIVEGADPDELVQRVEAIRHCVDDGASSGPTASVGLSIATQLRTTSCYALFSAADVALRRAKLSGRNCSFREPPSSDDRSQCNPQKTTLTAEIASHDGRSC